MKKIFTQTAMLLMLLLPMTTLTSCDSDTELAYQLDGVWQGEIASEFFTYRWGKQVEYFATEIHFNQAGAFEAGGTGYELDRNNRTYTRSFFHWTVRNGRIYIDYDDDTNTVVVRDFETYWVGDWQRFRGYFDDERTGQQLAHFDLTKVSADRDSYEFHYEYRHDFARKGSPAPADSIE